MAIPRIIPVLTLIDQGIYRTVKFKKPSYVGDPVNAVKIFNDKEVDELVVLDISPTEQWREEQLELLGEIASEAFMPMAYGGKIQSMEHIETIFELGYDKVILNTATIKTPLLIGKAASRYGMQSIAVSIDIKADFWGRKKVAVMLGKKLTRLSARQHALNCVDAGAGELIIRSVDRDGLMNGYDLELIEEIASAVNVPVIAIGGAGCLDDFKKALNKGAHSVAAGSRFVYQGPHRAVLINYPSQSEITEIISNT